MYGYSGSTHIDFFGGSYMASTLFCNAGLIGDYKLARHLYFFVNPLIEYKYFKNNSEASLNDIVHNILSFCVMGGIRYDVSK